MFQDLKKNMNIIRREIQDIKESNGILEIKFQK